MTPKEIHERLAANTERICEKLLPGGRKERNEWKCADLSGAPGDSLCVHLSGVKAGLWSDFATGSDKGDLFKLYMAVKNCSFKESIEWAKKEVGIHDREFDSVPKAVRSKPIRAPISGEVNQALEWFKKRGISKPTIEAYKITASGPRISLPYYVGDEVYFCKIKDISKPTKQSWQAIPDGMPILFGWQAIPDDARAVVITEGEWDALSYAEQGIAALSVPLGAGIGDKLKWIENDWDRLEQFDTIFLSFDMDKAGRDSIQTVAERLGRHRCMVVDIPDGFKDGNEAHQAGRRLINSVDSARHCDPVELRAMESFEDEIIAHFNSGTGCRGDSLPWSFAFDKFAMRENELTIWHGYSGHGKSMLLSQIVAFIMATGKRVCVASMELPAPKLLARMCQQMLVECNPNQEEIKEAVKSMRGMGWLVNIKGTAKSEMVLNLLDYAYRRYGVSHFVIDSLAKCGFAEDDYNGQKAFVDKLTDFTTERLVHVHLVAHDRKDLDESKTPGKFDVRGAAGITDMADNVIAVWRNKAKEEGRDKNPDAPDAIIHVQKQRHYDWEGKIGLWFDPRSHQYNEKGKRPERIMNYGK